MKMINAALLLTIVAIGPLAACSDGGEASPDGATDRDSGSDAGTSSADDAPAPDASTGDPQLRRLAAWMTGRFSSEKQSQQDLAYYYITLEMKRIWSKRTDGYWLYVEQAMAGSLPYRQRVYRLQRRPDGQLTSEVYELNSAAEKSKAVGAWKQANPLGHLTDKDLTLRTGCTVHLSWDAAKQVFVGATKPKACLTAINGAAYTSSESELSAVALRSWDRGFNSSGVQVWGAVKGPYIFDRIQNLDADLDAE